MSVDKSKLREMKVQELREALNEAAGQDRKLCYRIELMLAQNANSIFLVKKEDMSGLLLELLKHFREDNGETVALRGLCNEDRRYEITACPWRFDENVMAIATDIVERGLKNARIYIRNEAGANHMIGVEEEEQEYRVALASPNPETGEKTREIAVLAAWGSKYELLPLYSQIDELLTDYGI